MDTIYWLMLLPLPAAVLVAIWRVATRPKGESIGRTVWKVVVILSAGALLVFILFFGFLALYFTGPKAFQ